MKHTETPCSVDTCRHYRSIEMQSEMPCPHTGTCPIFHAVNAHDALVKTLRDSKISHYHCDDSWYSCPQHPEGCADESKGDECDCNAEKHNARINTALKLAGAE